MAYWKRQYTERPAGKPLFRPEPKSAAGPLPLVPPDPPDPDEPAADPSTEPQPPGEETTRAKPPS
jgi:hypothetical protein